MRRLLLMLLLFAFLPKAHAQLPRNFGAHVFLKFGGGLIDNTYYRNVSLSGELFVTPRIGLNYNLDLLARGDGFNQLHTTIGSLAGLSITSLVVFLLPDGVSLHFPYRSWDISPYGNFLGADYAWNKDYGYLKYAMSVGCKGTWLRTGCVSLNVYVESRKVAGMSWAIGAGFGIGIAFGESTADPADPVQDDAPADPL